MTRSARSPEFLAGYDLRTAEYEGLMCAVDAGLDPSRANTMTYVPLTMRQELAGLKHVTYADRDQAMLRAIVSLPHTAIVCLSRDELYLPSGRDPAYNISLTASSESNVATAAALLDLAPEGTPYIATGRMHHRAVRMLMAMPIIAEFIGINAEDAYHTPPYLFEERLRTAITPENIGKLCVRSQDSTEIEDSLMAHYQALNNIFTEQGLDVSDLHGNAAACGRAISALIQEYRAYPRISVSRLMAEEAADLGVPLAAIFEEDGSVDTISSMLFVAEMLQAVDGRNDIAEADWQDEIRNLKDVQHVVLVAGSDHLPRTMWIASRMFPANMRITCVESHPALPSLEAYGASCTREERSYVKGSDWIKDASTLREVEAKVEEGYFSPRSPNADQIAAGVARVAIRAARL